MPIRVQQSRARVQKVLKDDRRGGGVELRLALAPVALALGEARFGLVTRQPLVLQMNRQSGERAERLRELARRARLLVVLAVQPARQPDDDPAEIGQLVVARASCNNLRDGRGRSARRLGGRHGLPRPRERAARVRHGQPDAPVAVVHAEKSHAVA